MKLALAGALILGMLAVVPAEARPDTRSMTCAGVQSFVAQRGAVVMTTGRNTFERLVANRSFCQVSERLQTHRVQTSDANSCSIRWKCTSQRQDRFGGFFD